MPGSGDRAAIARLLIPVVAVAALLAFLKLDAATLFDVDEAVFAQATKEMVTSGDWITPTYNGVNRFDKPVFLYWFMALSYGVFGINEFGARFPSALAGLLLIVTVFSFTMRAAGSTRALHASVAGAISLYFTVYARAAVTDMTLTLFICLSLFSFYRWNEEPEKRIYLYCLYLFSALAFLTKGLIGILFPFGIAMVFLAATDGRRASLKFLDLKGVLLFLLVSAPWYITQLVINGPEFIDLFLFKHHLARFVMPISGQGQPFYYFIPVLLVALFPWVAYLPAGIESALTARDRLGLFSLIWFAFIVIFFSLSTTKLPNYVLPALPAAVLLISAGMVHEHASWKRYSDLTLALLAALLGTGLFVARSYAATRGIGDTGWLIVPVGLLLLMSCACVYAALARKRPYDLISGIMLVFLLSLIIQGLPMANSYLQGTIHRYSFIARDRLQGGGRLILAFVNYPSIVFYSGHRVTRVVDLKEFGTVAGETGRVVVITKAKDAAAIASEGFTLLEHDDRYAILERQ